MAQELKPNATVINHDGHLQTTGTIQNQSGLSSRRDLIKFGVLAMAATSVLTGFGDIDATSADATAATGRVDMRIDQAWQFLKQGFPGAQAPDFNDKNWTTVELPHSYNALDGQTGAPYYRGPTWYRKELDLPPAAAAPNKQVFLYFEAACTVAEVYCNGRHAGGHIGAFAGFCVDITPYINRNGRNVIAVNVNNAENNQIAPLSGDFNLSGGLYRHVRLLVLDALSISPLDNGGPGVYVKQVKVTPDKAELEITTMVRNASSMEKTAGVACSIMDHAGKMVKSGSATQIVPAGQTTACVQTLEIPNPHLWHGREDPYMYQAMVTISDQHRPTDSLTQPLGLRFFHVDPNHGFFLNGKSYPLRGVCCHQDRLNKARAVSDADLRQDMDIIYEVGATCVRMAHYQFPQTAYETADKLGLVVWAEDGLVNSVADNDTFSINQLQQVRELIKQNFNHPSICFWSLYNELTKSSRHSGNVILVKKLHAEAKKLDPTRLTTAADDQSPKDPLGYITDLIAFNRYPGWYGGNPKSMGKSLDGIRKVVEAKAPGRCMALSEYGAGASIYQHETQVTQPAPSKYWHPEEWQTIMHENDWAAIKQRPWLWGTFLWVAFDFSAANRHEGDHPGINDKGLVTYDRKTRKDAFYFYKAQWTTKPFVYITDRRFICRPDAKAVFKVYATCHSVELILNGQSLGARAGDSGIFVWPEATLKEGPNNIRAIGSHNGGKVEDTCMIVYDPEAPHHATYR